MKHILTIICMLAVSLSVSDKKKADAPTLYIYRYMLMDKAGTRYSVEKPEKFLSRKAIERRKKQGLSVNETDLPVSEKYIRQFRVMGAEVIGTSRWQNSVLVRSADTLLLQRLGQLTCVSESRCVWISPEKPDKPHNGEDDDI